MSLLEPLAAFLAATAVASALFWMGRVVSIVGENLHGAIAIVFLYAPALAARLARRPLDYRSAGLRVEPVRLSLAVTVAALALTWPVFFTAFVSFYGLVCDAQASAARWWWETFAPICPRWTGFAGASLRLPDGFVLAALTQLVVVAVPEEFFFRGYLYARFEERWPSRRRLAGAAVGWPLLVTSALFAVGHVLVDFDLQRLAVFFPALVFGWMRARTGAVAAGALFHALCNLFSEVLHTSFFR